MEDLKFDIFALVEPKNKEDVAALLKEAILINEQIHEVLDKIEEIKNKGVN